MAGHDGSRCHIPVPHLHAPKDCLWARQPNGLPLHCQVLGHSVSPPTLPTPAERRTPPPSNRSASFIEKWCVNCCCCYLLNDTTIAGVLSHPPQSGSSVYMNGVLSRGCSRAMNCTTSDGDRMMVNAETQCSETGAVPQSCAVGHSRRLSRFITAIGQTCTQLVHLQQLGIDRACIRGSAAGGSHPSVAVAGDCL